MSQLIVIEQSAWNELTGLVKTLAEKVDSLVMDRRQPQILTHKEAAAYLGYTPMWLHKLKDQKKIAFSQHSRKITYRLEDLDQFLKEHRIERRKY